MKVTDTVVEQSYYPVHVCTNEEFARFYPVENTSSTKVKTLKAKDQFLCFDMKEFDLDLYGNWRSHDSFTSIEPAFFPCASTVHLYDGTEQGGHDDCEWDKKAV